MIDRRACCALLALAGCARRPLDASTVHAARTASSAQCARHDLSDASPYHVALAGPVEDPALLPYLADVPPDVRRSVLASGMEPLLAHTLRERKEHPGETSLEQLEQRLELNTRLSSLDSQLSALLFESDCTGDALDNLAAELERREHATELRLTIASLVVGAASGVAAGVYQAKQHEGNGPAILSAAGAGATAVLGAAAFFPSPRPVRVQHPRNLLRPIQQGENPNHIFPSFVFRLLTLPMANGGPTPRDELLAAWRKQLEAIAPEGRAHAEAVLYGDGGVYDQTLMQLRQSMLDQLEDRLNAITREVEILERYILRATSQEDLTRP